MGFFDPFGGAADVGELKSDLSSVKSDIKTHTDNNDIHVTASDKSNWNSKLDKNQGSENSGKVLGTNANGEVIPLNGYGFEYDEETKMLKYGTDPTSNLNQGIGLDDTLSKRGYAADAGAVGELKEDLDTLNQGGLNLKDDFIGQQVNKWLNDHPEATTTVQDHTITERKLNEMLVEKIYYQRFCMFEGQTDTEKFNNFLLSENRGMYLDRDITVDNINFQNKNKFIDGRGHTIFVNGIIQPNQTYCQTYFISNCIFDGNGGGYFNLTNESKMLYEMYFTNCKFVNFVHDIFVGAEMQSFRFNHCYFQDNQEWVINVERADALTISSCNCEKGNNFVKLKKSLSCTIRDTVVEGLSGRAFYFRYFNRLKLDSIYMEGNYENICVDITNSNGMIIDNILCYCNGTSDEMVSIQTNEGRMNADIVIRNCHAIYGYILNVYGDRSNHELHIDLQPNNRADLGLIKNNSNNLRVQSNNIKHSVRKITGTGAELTYNISDFTTIFPNNLAGGFVIDVVDSVGRKMSNEYKKITFNGSKEFVLYGNGIEEMTYTVILLYF